MFFCTCFSLVLYPESWILYPESCILSPGSSILSPGSWVLDPESWTSSRGWTCLCGPTWLSSYYFPDGSHRIDDILVDSSSYYRHMHFQTFGLPTLWNVLSFQCTHGIYCTSVRPGRGIPPLCLSLRFLPVSPLTVGFLWKSFLVRCEGYWAIQINIDWLIDERLTLHTGKDTLLLKTSRKYSIDYKKGTFCMYGYP